LSNIRDIVASYSSASKVAGLKLSLELKTSQSAARQETNTGLKCKAGDEDYGKPSQKKKVITSNCVHQ
jgi:hypothetical protein